MTAIRIPSHRRLTIAALVLLVLGGGLWFFANADESFHDADPSTSFARALLVGWCVLGVPLVVISRLVRCGRLGEVSAGEAIWLAESAWAICGLIAPWSGRSVGMSMFLLFAGLQIPICAGACASVARRMKRPDRFGWTDTAGILTGLAVPAFVGFQIVRAGGLLAI